jgi:sarcosine oxidase subunit beta
MGVTAVTVVERDYPASASTGLSVGIIETQYLDHLAIEIRVLSMRFFDELERMGSLEIRRNGYLRLAHTSTELQAFHESASMQRELGVQGCEVLDRDGLRNLVPELFCDDLEGGLFGSRDGYIDGHLYCGVLCQFLVSRGGRVLNGAKVIGVTRASKHAHRVRTSEGDIDCDVVVNAAGGWAGQVGDLLGAPVAILPQRHRALVARLPQELGYVMPSVMDYLPTSGGYGLYFRDEGPMRLIAGLHTEEAIHDTVDPDDFSRGSDQEYVDLVAERMAKRLPSLAGMHLGDVWAGLYPLSPDGKPIIGPHPGCESVVTVAGAGGSGLQSSPALGMLAAEWIVHGEPRTIPAARSLAPRPEAFLDAVQNIHGHVGGPSVSHRREDRTL